ncbi:hypothetical protein ABB55_16780 [Prosthecomicrobium hirschii]|uniref:Uncharacterized protein n=1 Tax=Prosthecodimorpha hirschii TaxID=665126 RepID=A0A0P6W5F8_9HYPH|nr:hypothetical protein ABB55_16780 [Prosthecomicrobium hirschii]
MRHHSVLAWLQLPSKATTPSMPLSAAAWSATGLPSLSTTARSRPGGKASVSTEPRCITAQRFTSTSRPTALDRLGQDSPTLKMPPTKCRTASRAEPSVTSCSCGCCRMASLTRVSTGSTKSQTHKAAGLPQCGQDSGAAAGKAGVSVMGSISVRRSVYPVVRPAARAE